MRKGLILLLALFSCTSRTSLKCLQVDYTDSTGPHTIYLNVKETYPYEFQVLSQENLESTPFVIHQIFDYNSINYE